VGALFAGLLKLPVLFLIVLRDVRASVIPEVAAARPRVSELDPATATDRNGGSGGRGIRGGDHGVDRLDAQFGVDPITMDVIRQFTDLSDSAVVRIGRISTGRTVGDRRRVAPQLSCFPCFGNTCRRTGVCRTPVVALFLVGMFGAAPMATAPRRPCGWVAVRLRSFPDQCGAGWTHFHFLYACAILTLLDAAILSASVC